jgi:hypothetical protein
MMRVEKQHVTRGGKNIIFRRGGGEKYLFWTEIKTLAIQWPQFWRLLSAGPPPPARPPAFVVNFMHCY